MINDRSIGDQSIGGGTADGAVERPLSNRTWVPRGKRPVLRRVSSDRRALSTAVGLIILGRIYKRYFEGAMDSDDVIEALKHLPYA